MKWLIDNANWIFSGVGLLLFTGLGYLVKRLRKREFPRQQQKVEGGSIGIQAGGGVNIGRDNDQGQR